MRGIEAEIKSFNVITLDETSLNPGWSGIAIAPVNIALAKVDLDLTDSSETADNRFNISSIGQVGPEDAANRKVPQ